MQFWLVDMEGIYLFRYLNVYYKIQPQQGP